LGVDFLDAAPIVETGDHDGVHLSAEEHNKLGTAIARAVENLFPKTP
jgi:hypothetical protein